jgi:hypothetical protein
LLASRVLMALSRLDDATEEGDQAIRRMRKTTIGGVLLPQLQVTQGEFLLRKGEIERGRAVLREAVAKLRTDPGSDMWTQTLLRLEAVWRLSRDLGDRILAADVAKQMQQYDPHTQALITPLASLPSGKESSRKRKTSTKRP